MAPSASSAMFCEEKSAPTNEMKKKSKSKKSEMMPM
jgi:hypothetical protein